MSDRLPHYIREAAWGAAGLALGLLAVVGVYANDWWNRPYGNVDILEVAREANGDLRVSADFEKWGCDLLEFIPYALVAGRFIPVNEVDLHGRADDESREPGKHSLDIIVPIGPLSASQVELRTVHDCEGEHVTLVFATVDVPPKKEKTQ